MIQTTETDKATADTKTIDMNPESIEFKLIEARLKIICQYFHEASAKGISFGLAMSSISDLNSNVLPTVIKK